MPTMADVAALAGVSIATVSRALSSDGKPVSATARKRVLVAAEELAYHPNNLARNMRSGSSRIFGLVISDIGNPFFTAVARGAEDVAQRHGYALVLSNTDENQEREASSLRAMAAERAAGVIVATTNENNESLRRLLEVGIPIVGIDRRIDSFKTDMVAVDNEGAAHEAVSHLIRLGHTKIAMIAGPKDANTSQARIAGLERAFRDHRIPQRPNLYRYGNFRETGGASMTRELLDLAEPPTAIFSVNNLTTIGVLQALRERNVHVPEALSLVGFDDIPTGELLDPPLTVIQQPTYQIGAQAAELLIRRLEEPTASVREVILSATLLIRGSTGLVAQST